MLLNSEPKYEKLAASKEGAILIFLFTDIYYITN